MFSFDPALFSLVCLEMGIVPNSSIDKDGDELKGMLDQLTPEEARKCKRKFRKIHRKLRKRKMKNAETHKNRKILLHKFGNSGEEPNKGQRRRRRDTVRAHIRHQSVIKWNDE
jgi:hypothetical protein